MVTPKVISSCGISACHIPLRHRSLTNTRRKKENVLSSSERIPHPLDQSQVLDSDGKRKGFYRVVASDDGDGGLAVDNEGNIYISYVASSIISMYQPDGTPLGTFGQPGSRIGNFVLLEACGSMATTASTFLIRGTRGCKSFKSASPNLPAVSLPPARPPGNRVPGSNAPTSYAIQRDRMRGMVGCH